jgi:hypothetical protein
MSRQLDTVIAALRHWQATNGSIPEIAENPLTHKEIDTLIESINVCSIDPTETTAALAVAQGFQARRVYQAIFANTESFSPFGALTAYLLGAILTGSVVDLTAEDDADAFVEMLRDTFEPFDHVWDYVILPSL